MRQVWSDSLSLSRDVTAEGVRVSPAWLALREAADAAARAPDLVELVRLHTATDGLAVIHDLGCGTGAMARWLAPQLSGAQQWIMYDRDAGLLELSTADLPCAAADGSAVTAVPRQRDVTRLGTDDLAGASLITASALLDMLTAEELERFAAACARAGCPVLMTISVVGRVDLTPADSLDERVAEAFNDHQRRTIGSRRPLGPDAVEAAVRAFTRLGAHVVVRPSPWQLGAAQAALAAQWFAGWWGAACDQRPELAAATAAYAQRRIGEAASGRLSVRVRHVDLLVLPGEGAPR